jgi:hypothetical protein
MSSHKIPYGTLPNSLRSSWKVRRYWQETKNGIAEAFLRSQPDVIIVKEYTTSNNT